MGFQFNREASHLLVHVSGRLTTEDYEAFVPATDGLIGEFGLNRLLIDLDGFEGWTLSAAVEDMKFSIRHFSDIERIAVAGDQQWERMMTTLFKPFTRAEVRYFNRRDLAQAREWVEAE